MKHLISLSFFFLFLFSSCGEDSKNIHIGDYGHFEQTIYCAVSENVLDQYILMANNEDYSSIQDLMDNQLLVPVGCYTSFKVIGVGTMKRKINIYGKSLWVPSDLIIKDKNQEKGDYSFSLDDL